MHEWVTNLDSNTNKTQSNIPDHAVYHFCRHQIIEMLEQFPVPVDASGAFTPPDGNKIFSRAALEGLGSEELAQIMTQAGKRSSIAAGVHTILCI